MGAEGNEQSRQTAGKTKMIHLSTSLKYYKREDVQKALVEHAKDKEVAARFNEQFGKRPDTLAYPGDVLELARQGAISFHCSEELWENPLLLQPQMQKKDLDKYRKGWDLLLDVDCVFIEYSKIAADLIVKELKLHGVKSVTAKFSVTGDTPVLVKIGHKINLISIHEAIRLFKMGEQPKILSLDMSGFLRFSKVYDYLKHRDRVYEMLHEQTRIPLKVTAHHSVFVWKNGFIKQKAVRDIKKGEYLVTYGSSNKLKRKKRVELTYTYQYMKKEEKSSARITKDLMRLLGYYLAEGHLTISGRMNQIGFTFNSNENSYIQDCKTLLEDLTNKKASIRHPNKGSTQLIIHSKKYCKFFEEACGKGAKNKHIPPFAWTAPKHYITQLLLGYLRGDGCKTNRYSITAKSLSHQLVSELVWIAKLNSLSCSLNQETSRPHALPQGIYFKGSHVFTINIPRSELKGTEFFIERNKYSPYPNDKLYPVDGLRYVYNQCEPGGFNRHRVEQVTLRKELANNERIRSVMNWLKKTKKKKFNGFSKQIIRNYEQLMRNDVATVRVISTKKRNKQLVYDVSVEETGNFFGNHYPVLLHNSGNKGFHIAVPWEAFPKSVMGEETEDLFPEAPKKIAHYIKERIKKKLGSAILEKEGSFKSVAEKTGRKIPEITVVSESAAGARQDVELNAEPFLVIDTLLISSRHMYRMPYSLHEKSGLASVPVNADKVMDFAKEQAIPEKAKVGDNPFMDRAKARSSEAEKLFLAAYDFGKTHTVKAEKVQARRTYYDEEEAPGKIPPQYFPPCIKKLLEGLGDGRKRALFVLINFLGGCNYSHEEIEAIVKEWNQKNKEPLPQLYLQSQLSYNKQKNEKVLPPNCSNASYYSEIGIECTAECGKCKNPVAEAKQIYRRAMRQQPQQRKQTANRGNRSKL